MKTYTEEELQAVLTAHREWVETDGDRGSRANLARAYLAGANLAGANLAGAYLEGAYLEGANLAGANLAGANLAGANLAGANLAGANLAGAYIPDDLVMPEGITFAVFRDEVVPALLRAGGRVVTAAAWECHSWTNCPMAEAFGVHDLGEVPALWRPWANRFIQFFDAKLLPCPAFLPPGDACPIAEVQS